MKRLFLISFCLSASVFSLFALTIPQGTLYFDNSKTQYNAVRFVYGSNQTAQTYAIAMTQDGDKWRVEIPQTVNAMYRFTFVGGAIREGLYTQDFNTFKDSISHQANLNRTATSDTQMNAGDIYVPESGDNWTQGNWTTLSAWQSSQGSTGTAGISGTLPVVYISTTNNTVISSKETYISGSLYIDPLTTGYSALGSADAPIAAQFKGRGNYTWRDFDKKPYKIKFDNKQPVLGMPNNRHWCLQPHADDDLGFLRDKVGHMLSEQIGLRWTPRIVPVEVVINGQYHGLYFLTEHVRIASNRINITEQGDNSTDSVSGGWLVEIDNYSEAGNITFTEGNGQEVMITVKEPEVLSAQQRSYIENQIYTLNAMLYASETPLFSMLDLDEAAKYYLIQEIMEDCESYHGSCFLYKDRDHNGVTAKWCFGPVWDFGNAYMRRQDTWIYDNPIFDQYWIAQLATWPAFQRKVKEYWWIYYHDQRALMSPAVSEFVTLIAQAAKNDAARWRNTRNYRDNSNMVSRQSAFLSRFNARINWLYSQWGEGIQPATWDYQSVFEKEQPSRGRKVLRNGQFVIMLNGHTYSLVGQLIE